MVVIFDGSRSACYEDAFDAMGIVYPVALNFSFLWDFGGPGMVIGGNGSDIVVYQYDTTGTYNATIAITEEVSGLTETDTVSAQAIEVEDPVYDIDFAHNRQDYSFSEDGDLSVILP